MFKSLMFWLKYKRISTMSVEQYNTGYKFLQEIDMKAVHSVLFSSSENIDYESLNTLYKEVDGFNVLSQLASCVIKPRFGTWKGTNRFKYAKDVSKSINRSLALSGFFLSSFGLKFPILGNYLKALAKLKE